MSVDFKARLFCAATNLPRSEVDASDPLWIERINGYFDNDHGLPPAGDPTEYAAAFEAAYPSAKDRRAYIDSAVRLGTPSFGHRVLASMVTSGRVPCMFTTNFDGLIEKSAVVSDDLVDASERSHLTVAALDSVDRAVRCLEESSWPLLVKLHGDYQSEQLKNTSTELQQQDAHLRQVFTEALRRFGLVVVGYSGRDASVMDAIDEALSQSSALPGGLWWVIRPDSPVLDRVGSTLELAERQGVEVAIVESETFDELAGDLAEEVEIHEALRTHIMGLRPAPVVVPVDLSYEAAQLLPVVRCSALQILSMPLSARQITLGRPITTAEARTTVREAAIWATVASRGRSIVGFGNDVQLANAFGGSGGEIAGDVPLNPEESSSDLGLLYDAFVRAVTRRRPLRAHLRSKGHEVRVLPPDASRTDDVAAEARRELSALRDAYGGALTGTVPGSQMAFAEAIRISLEFWESNWWCVYTPFTWVDLPRGARTPETEALVELAGDWRRERWAQRYNPAWNNIIAGWGKLLAPTEHAQIQAHHFQGPGDPGSFELSWTTAWSAPANRLTSR